MSTTGWIILGVANAPLYFVLGWAFFKNWAGFWECARFWITPDIISLFRGEYWDDWWASFKLGLWIAACVACVLCEAAIIGRILG